MGTNILNTAVLNDPGLSAAQKEEIILNSHGFAEVFPEHKFQIVDAIQRQVPAALSVCCGRDACTRKLILII
jgi:hypothetical protein